MPRLVLILALVLTGAVCPCSGAAPEAESGAEGTASNDVRQVVLRGRVVCLAEEAHRQLGTELPANHAHLQGFRTDAGAFFTLLRTRFSEALFSDPRVQGRELLLKGRLLPRSGVLDVSRFQGIREGRIEELDYFCSVCSIQGPTPGPCPCCQDDLEFRVQLTDEPVPETTAPPP